MAARRERRVDHDRPSVAVYARTARDDGHRSREQIGRQQQECAAAATRLGAHVVGGFVDVGHPGTQTNRPGLNHLLAYAEENPIDYVAVSSIDRLTRNTGHAAFLLLRLKALGANVLLADSDTVIELVLPSGIEALRGDLDG